MQTAQIAAHSVNAHPHHTKIFWLRDTIDWHCACHLTQVVLISDQFASWLQFGLGTRSSVRVACRPLEKHTMASRTKMANSRTRYRVVNTG